jgi:hypothetical protein
VAPGRRNALLCFSPRGETHGGQKMRQGRMEKKSLDNLGLTTLLAAFFLKKKNLTVDFFAIPGKYLKKQFKIYLFNCN